MSRIMRRGAAYTDLIAVFALAPLVAAACASPTGGTATPSGGAEELVRSLYKPFSTGDVELLAAVLAPDWESIPVVEGQEQGPDRE